MILIFLFLKLIKIDQIHTKSTQKFLTKSINKNIEAQVSLESTNARDLTLFLVLG